jgi:hypothetical protein
VRVLHLTEHVRVLRHAADSADATEVQTLRGFARWVLDTGDGVTPVYPEHGPRAVRVPDHAAFDVGGPDDVIREAYGDISRDVDAQRMLNTTILAPLNAGVDELDEAATRLFKSAAPPRRGGAPTERTYHIVDTSHDTPDSRGADIPVEFLHAIKLGTMPLHELHVKEGMTLMLMRNLNLLRDMANGTRVTSHLLHHHVIQCAILTGPHAGRIVLLPRITLEHKEDRVLGPTFKRRQFPVRAAFAMTINKAQGQDFQRVVVYMCHPMFTHGQWYVAVSRATTPDGPHVCVVDGRKADGHVYTDNIVYTQALLAPLD